MSDFKLLLPKQLAQSIPDKPLSEPDVLVDVLQGQVQEAPNLGLQGVSFSVGAGTSVTVQGFNSTTDKDEDGVLGVPMPPGKQEELGPQLTLGERAWLKYKAEARVKAAAGANLSFLSTDVEGGLTVALSDYRAHELTKNAREAVLGDVEDLRLALRAGDLEKLQPHDALSFQLRGNLKVALELKWSDLFTSNLGPLTSLLQSGTLLSLKTQVGVTLSATAALTDDFLVVFSRPAAGSLRVGVRKAVSRGIHSKAGLGIDLQLVDPAAAEKVLDGVLESLAGFTQEQVSHLLDKAAEKVRDEKTERDLGTFVLRLGLDYLKDNPDALKQEWQKLRDEARKTLLGLAKARLTAGLSYEYLRLGTESTLLQVVLSDADARELHPAFVTGDLARVVERMKEKGLKPEKYLSQRTLVQSSVVGFSFGYNDHVLRSQETKKVERVTQKNFRGEERLAYVGQRVYEGSLFGFESMRISVDFKADMEGFVKDPRAADLAYGLHCAMHHESGRLSGKELRRAIDEAIVWRVLDEAQEEEVFQQLQAAMGQSQRVETRLELRLEDSRLRELLPLLAAADASSFARALGRSMPWDVMPARSVVQNREDAYAPLWLAYLKKPDLDMRTAASTAVHHLRSNPLSNDQVLLYSEGRLEPGIWSFAQLVRAQTSTAAKWRTFTEGARLLHEAVTSGAGHDAFGPAFEKMEDLWRVPFQLKALGAHLLHLALQTPRGLSGIERTFTVRLKDAKQEEQQLVFTTSR